MGLNFLKNKRLELTWIGKENNIKVEPRILIENKNLSNTINDENTENLLIYGDNLLALKALEQKYTGKIKCIYIDPPYNTGSAFEHYDDNVEHSTWLNLMKPRLEILRKLLSENGSIFIQIDDNEQAYLKVLCDEIFGRQNFVTTIVVKMSTVSGVKTTHREKTVIKEKEMILVYAKNNEEFRIKPQYVLVNDFDNEFQYYLEKNDSDKPDDWEIKRLNDILQDKNIPKDYNNKKFQEFLRLHKENIWRRAFIRNEYKKLSQDNPDQIFHIQKESRENYYYRGREMFFLDKKFNVCFTEDGYIDGMSNLLGDIWLDINTGKLFNEGGVKFRNGKKPEFLVARILDMVTEEGDIVLDSFLGSGTTAAVAHKMKRKWIGVELGEHALTHSKPRLDSVIEGEQGGISKGLKWNGGGGYKFMELAPTLIKIDAFGQEIINPLYNQEMLASTIALHEGFTFKPNKDSYWKQSKNGENSYLFVTTQHITKNHILSILEELKPEETLLIVCKSFEGNLNTEAKNISLKKIPSSLLKNCEFDAENYNLNVKDEDYSDFIEEADINE